MAREYVKELECSVEVNREELFKTVWLNDFTEAVVEILRHPEQDMAHGLDTISERVDEEMTRWCLLPVAPTDFERQCVATEVGNWLHERAEEYYGVVMFKTPGVEVVSEPLILASLGQVVWSEIADAAIRGAL
jgi:hypothetical protein